MQIKKATRKQSKLRMAIMGPSGSGKTYTSIKLATLMFDKVGVIDSENGTASKYADEFDFDVIELADDYSPDVYIQAIRLFEKEGYDCIVIDSMTHEWSGKNGCLELVDKLTRTKWKGNSYAAWSDVTPKHTRFLETITTSKCHIIATMRSKMDYVQTEDSKGNKVIRKVGMEPITRDGAEYEFDIVLDMNLENTGEISKSRANKAGLTHTIWEKPGEELAKTIKDWIEAGEEPEPKPWSMTREMLVSFYDLVKSKGCTDKSDMVAVVANIAPEAIVNDEISWDRLTEEKYDILILAFEGDNWQAILDKQKELAS